MTQLADRWSLVVPVKRLENAKTRLGIDAESRASLAVAMAVDTVVAALACPLVGSVVVVTDDGRARAALEPLGIQIEPDVPDAGLNAALEHGVAIAANGHVGALASDLPALRPDDLTVVLRRAEAHDQSVVGDVSGTGTTLLCARSAAQFAPRFGVASLAAHLAAGATDLTDVAPPSLRRDVDTIDALSAAVDLGVGAATRRALDALPVAEGL
ncbi:MAG TPA: 2-phospho-L-lactate guanylyltransferase [Mycobacteriales bacterium]|nr:2-phospho-L-lactate guanylyltransferase [Mycobacteriales bacterium]